jgi:hypothetical protein
MTPDDSAGPAPDYVAPHAELVDSALARIGNPQHRQVFYSKLENPKWVLPLTEKGAFNDVPPVTVDEQGVTLFVSWSQGEYLARMASVAPREVAAALRPALGSDNPAVQRVVLEAASRMPVEHAADLVTAIRSYVTKPYRAWLDPNKLVAIVRLLAEGGRMNHAKQFADALYRPRQPAQATSDPDSGLDSYWYAQTLPAAIKALNDAPKMLPTVVIWLELWAKFTPYARAMSSLWRNEIESDERMQPTEPVGHALVNAVRDLARARIDAGQPLPEIVEQIERGRESIFLRLSLDTIAYALRHVAARDSATQDVEDSVGPDVELVGLAHSRLVTPELLSGEYRPEYHSLARSVLRHLSVEQIDQWERLVAEPPHLSAEQVARMFGGVEVTDDEVARQIGLWQRDLLAGIGREALPDRLQQRLDALIVQHGEPYELNNPQRRGAVFVGPTSPLSDAEVASLSPEDLLAYLRSWEPSREPSSLVGFPPSAEGLARNVTRAVTLNPGGYAQLADHFTGVRSTYVAALFDGFQQAIGQQHGFAWEPVLKLAAYVAAQPDDDTDASGGNHGAEPWRHAQQQAARLIQAGIEADEALAIPPTLYTATWEALRSVTRSPHPTPQEEGQYGPPSSDAMTLSLNTARPVALRTAIRLLVASSRHPGDEATTTVMQEILTTIDEHAGPTSDASLAVAAVFGEGLGMLLAVAREWTEARLERVLGRPERSGGTPAEHQAWFDTAWAVMLTGYRPSRGLYDPLEPWFRQHIRELGSGETSSSSVPAMRSPQQSLADHVLMLFVTGQLDDGLRDVAVMDLFAYADNALLRDALGHLGWQLLSAQGDISETVLARFRALWDWRAQQVAQGDGDREELLDFYWWVASGRLSADWWLPHLALVAADPDFNPHEMLGEHLAQAAAAHPGQVVDVFAALRTASGRSARSYDLLEHAPAILKPALASGQPDLVERARELAERLGNEDGYTDLMDHIRALPD